MSEDRRKILDMLAAAKITADEAERLIAAMDKEPPSSAPGEATARTGAAPKYLRVVVDEMKNGTSSANKVNIRVPLLLLRAGVRLASLLPAGARTNVNAALRDKGVKFDLSEIRPENIEELIAGLNDIMIDVDADGGKVKVFCE